MWEQVDVVLKDAKGILDELQAYKGAGAEIREVHPEKTSQFSGPDAGSPVVAGREERREGALHSSADSSRCHVVCPSIQAVRRDLKKTLMALVCF